MWESGTYSRGRRGRRGLERVEVKGAGKGVSSHHVFTVVVPTKAGLGVQYAQHIASRRRTAGTGDDAHVWDARSRVMRA